MSKASLLESYGEQDNEERVSVLWVNQKLAKDESEQEKVINQIIQILKRLNPVPLQEVT